MIYRTYLSLKSEVLVETDAEAEEFIQPSEVMGYFNDGIREALSHIQKLGLEDDYFQKTVAYSLTNGQTDILMPADIFAVKIRGLIYATPSKVYPLKRIKGKDKFATIQSILQAPTGTEFYRYDIENPDTASGYRLKLYPPSYETTPSCIQMTYVRTVETITGDTSLVDIPEFYSFIKAFVTWRIHAKENDSKVVEAKENYLKEKQLMIDTLSEMTPDYDTEIRGDYSAYEDHA